MSGADVLAQVREALSAGKHPAGPHSVPVNSLSAARLATAALAALDGCIVLTLEEAEFIARVLVVGLPVDQERALALLAPEDVAG